MFSIFSPDSKLMQVLTRLTDLVLLNILFLLTCIPVFTIGAATASLYTLCFRMLRQEESGILKPYFRAFKENFKPATGVFSMRRALRILQCTFSSLWPHWQFSQPVLPSPGSASSATVFPKR